MKDTIFLLTFQKTMESIVRDSIPVSYDLQIVNKNDIMVEMYKKNPVLLIIDLDGITEQTLEMIQSIITLNYLPVVYICSEITSWVMDNLKDDIILTYDNIPFALKNLIKQSVSFKKKYDKINESYEAIDLLSGEIKELLDSRISDIEEKNEFAEKLFNLALGKNKFLSNKPDLIWVIEPYKDEYAAALYSTNAAGEFQFKEKIMLKENVGYYFEVSSENGFSKNFNIEEMSDIGSSRKIFPEAMRKATGRIINFSGYIVNHVILAGFNYFNPVTNYDTSIIKALTIYYDLVQTIKTNIDDLEESFEYTTNALARAAEVNDDTTGSHIKRVNTFSKLLAKEMNLDKKFIKVLYSAAQMHDVGKIYVDKNILSKPGKLTDEEFQDMKKHTVYGEKIIGDAKHLEISAEIARNHHERYDGTGYPEGKKGEEIPLAARIVALADIYDALRSPRSYKPGFSHEKCYEIITQGDGRVQPEHFDPEVLQAFKNIHEKMRKVYDDLSE